MQGNVFGEKSRTNLLEAVFFFPPVKTGSWQVRWALVLPAHRCWAQQAASVLEWRQWDSSASSTCLPFVWSSSFPGPKWSPKTKSGTRRQGLCVNCDSYQRALNIFAPLNLNVSHLWHLALGVWDEERHVVDLVLDHKVLFFPLEVLERNTYCLYRISNLCCVTIIWGWTILFDLYIRIFTKKKISHFEKSWTLGVLEIYMCSFNR